MELDPLIPLIPLGALEPRSHFDANACPKVTNSASIVLTKEELAEMHAVPVVPTTEKTSRFCKALAGFTQTAVLVLQWCNLFRRAYGWYISFRIPVRRTHGYKIAPAHGVRKALFGPVKYRF